MTRHLFLFLFSFAFVAHSMGQIDVNDIHFKSKTMDFGQIYVEHGVVTASYDFTNMSRDTFVISDVDAACGCTNPRSTKMRIAPGESAKILAEFNPQGMIGEAKKWIYVRGNFNNDFQIKLEFTANIGSTSAEGVQQRYPGQFGYLVLSESALSFGTIYQDVKYDSIMIFNDGDRVYSVKEVQKLPSFMKVTNLPLEVAPKSKAYIKLSINSEAADTIGPYLGSMSFTTDDRFFATKTLEFRMNFIQDFSGMSRRQLKRAPKIEVSSTELDFGVMHPGQKKTVKFTITNTGRSPLRILRLSSDCSCAIISNVQRSIAPGETIEAVAEFDALFKDGKQRKPITVYTNSPSRPKFSIFLLAEVK